MVSLRRVKVRLYSLLPAGSEITVTVDFNTTLPSGSYLVRLSSWDYNHGESFFTIL